MCGAAHFLPSRALRQMPIRTRQRDKAAGDVHPDGIDAKDHAFVCHIAILAQTLSNFVEFWIGCFGLLCLILPVFRRIFLEDTWSSTHSASDSCELNRYQEYVLGLLWAVFELSWAVLGPKVAGYCKQMKFNDFF